MSDTSAGTRGTGPATARGWAWRFVTLAVLAGTAVIALTGLRNEAGHLVGSGDFVAFSAGFEVAADGGDPYDPQQVLVAQQEVQPGRRVPQLFVSPPWTLLLLAPVLALPFESAVAVWFVMSCAVALLLVRLCWRLVRPETVRPPPWVVAVSVVTLPVAEGLVLGQLGLLVGVLTIGGLVALHAGRDALAGALLGLLVVKPQAVLLVLLVVGVHVVGARRWRALGAAAASATVLVAGSALAFPSAWAAWGTASLPSHLHTATLSGAARTAFLYATGQDTRLPILLVPLAATALLLPWAFRHRFRLQWEALPLLIAASVLAAPYAWVYDGAALLLIQVAAAAVWVERRPGGREVMVAALAIQAVAFWFTTTDGADHRHLVVLPVAMLVLGMVMYERGDFSAEPNVRA